MVSAWLVYTTSVWYAICLAFTYVLVPLYALELGLSAFQIGLLFSLPTAVQVIAALAGGILSDRFGEKALLLTSYLLLVGVGPAFVHAGSSFLALLGAQLLASLSRSLFWAPSQGYLTRIAPRGAGQRLGAFNTSINLGLIAGSALAGLAALWLGYRGALLGMAVLAAVGLVLAAALRPLPPAGTGRTLHQVLRGFGQVARRRSLYLGGLCAFFGGVPIVLVGSFYPVYLVSVGHDASTVGLVSASLPIGSLACTAVVGRILDRLGGHRPAYVAALLLYVAAFGLTPATAHPAWLALLVALAGVGSGILQVTSSLVVVQQTDQANRSGALALVGDFWSLSHLTVPVVYGAVTETVSLSAAFFGTGCLALLAAAVAWPTHRWFLAQPRVATEVKVEG